MSSRAQPICCFIALIAFNGVALSLASISAAAADPVPRESAHKHLEGSYDFEIHMKLHIHRARVLALEAQKLPDYQDVPIELLREYMTLHDQSKINQTREFLVRHGIVGREMPILDELSSFVGENTQSLVTEFGPERGKELAQELRELIQELNRVDHEVAMNFFAAHGLLRSDGTLCR